jgi:hypothetical protein
LRRPGPTGDLAVTVRGGRDRDMLGEIGRYNDGLSRRPPDAWPRIATTVACWHTGRTPRLAVAAVPGGYNLRSSSPRQDACWRPVRDGRRSQCGRLVYWVGHHRARRLPFAVAEDRNEAAKVRVLFVPMTVEGANKTSTSDRGRCMGHHAARGKHTYQAVPAGARNSASFEKPPGETLIPGFFEPLSRPFSRP